MKPPLEPTAIVHPAPVQTRHVDLRELRKAIDRYCREQKHFRLWSSNTSVKYTFVRKDLSQEVAVKFHTNIHEFIKYFLRTST